MTVANEAVTFFSSRFRQHADADSALAQKQYMKSELDFHGVSARDVRDASREFAREHPELTRKDLRAVAEALFAKGSFDLRSGAIGLLERRTDALLPSDTPWLIGLVREASCWAHVDWLATKVVGAALEQDDDAAKRIRTWAKDKHLWVRRTALLAQLDLLRQGEGDFALFEEIALPMLEEKVFWIRKAIGWVLREVSKKRPALVRGFVRRHRAKMSGLTLREAAKYI